MPPEANTAVDVPALGQKYLDAKATRIRAKAALNAATEAHEKARLQLATAAEAEKSAEAEYSAAITGQA